MPPMKHAIRYRFFERGKPSYEGTTKHVHNVPAPGDAVTFFEDEGEVTWYVRERVWCYDSEKNHNIMFALLYVYDTPQ